MTIPLYPEFYNDVFGPIMQPGSSSHTAAPCRLGYLARSLLGEQPVKVRVLLDTGGSFAGTFGIMNEDNAMLSGVLGFFPDDARLFEAAKFAQAAGLDYAFEFGEMKESTHINAMKFTLTGVSGKTITLVGDSTGGGMVETQWVNGYPLQVRGDSYVVLIFDREMAVTAAQLEQIGAALASVVEAGTTQAQGRGALHWFKAAVSPDLDALAAWLPGREVALLSPILPVITSPERKPQLFTTMTRWREIAAERSLPLWEIAVQYEMDASGWTRAEIIDYMRQIARRLHRQTHAAYEDGVVVPETPFKLNWAGQWDKHMRSPRRLTDDITANTIRWAHGAGAGIPGVETVAGPMGSGGGYIYGALDAVKQARGFLDEDLLRGLFVAAGIGAIAYTRTEPTGEVIGCTGECGLCGAMAAAAIAEMAGGTPEEVENAASLSLQASIGMPCDPIPGGKSQPCRSRILMAICTASVFADVALSGRDAVLPLHEVIDVADAVGRQLPADLLCTSRGGVCMTPSARRQSAAFRAWYEKTQAENAPRPPGNLI